MQVLWNRREVIIQVDDELTLKVSPEQAQEVIDDLEEALLTIEGPENRRIREAVAPLKPIAPDLEPESLLSAEVAATMDSAGVLSGGKTPVWFDPPPLISGGVPCQPFANSAVGGTPPDIGYEPLTKVSAADVAPRVKSDVPFASSDEFIASIQPHSTKSHKVMMAGREWVLGDAARIRNALSLVIDTQTQKSFAVPVRATSLNPDQAANLAATNGDT